MAAEFRLLGVVEAFHDGQPITIGYAQLRCVLVVLLIEANRAVSVDHIVDHVWGTRRLPHRPRRAVQHNMTLLRHALAAIQDITIDRRSNGYQLTIDTETVDLHRFSSLLGAARATADDNHAAALFEQALHLWRGEPFTSLDTPWLNSQRALLGAQRQAAQLDQTDIQLRIGRHTALLGGLADQVERHPLDERIACQYLLALYRSGRQADALQHYQHIRRQLAEDLGTDPGPPLQRLHQQILTADPALTAATTGVTPRSTVPVVPRQLPAPPPWFTGRTRDLATLTTTLGPPMDTGNAVAISVIGGTAGIGKTSLALHWAHQHLDQFPDGQLHVNLRGFDPTGQPTTPVTALRGFLDALGVDPRARPTDLDAQVGLYRSLVTDKRMLIVLDNAADTAQVTPLLPGSGPCTVVVTSRRRLASLITKYGARSLDLDVLSDAEARDLLARQLVGDRLAGQPHALTELLNYCAGLPLAISIVAARARSHPDFPLSVLADELRDQTSRLDALDAGDTDANLRAVLSWSHHALSTQTARVFGLLGLAPGPDISLPAAVSLTALSTAQARMVLRDLENAHLLQQYIPGRYRMHDLVRLHAAELGQRDRMSDDAMHRIADFYLHTAVAGDQLLTPLRAQIQIEPPAHGCEPDPPPDEVMALAWFNAEHQNLLAAQRMAFDRGWYDRVWQLAWALSPFYMRRGGLYDNLEAWRIGLAATEALSDFPASALAHRFLGRAYGRLGRYDDDVAHLQQALALLRQTKDLFGQAHTHRSLAWARAQQGHEKLALGHAVRALRLYQAVNAPVWEAEARSLVGWHYSQSGEYDLAREYCEKGLALHREHHNQEAEANALDSLGYIAHHAGQHAAAIGYYAEALAIQRERHDVTQEADTLVHLGEAQSAAGKADEARQALYQALALYRTQCRTADANRTEALLTQI
jgi:DNA-binding SARP family transcriptional activator/tetratricopeptide (TPR) repeat protein